MPRAPLPGRGIIAHNHVERTALENTAAVFVLQALKAVLKDMAANDRIRIHLSNGVC